MPKAPKVKPDPQAGMFDREISDEELEDALDKMLDTQESATAFAKARTRMTARCKQHNLQPKERIRVGKFVVRGRERRGGGFKVPAWTSVVAEVVSEGTTEA